MCHLPAPRAQWKFVFEIIRQHRKHENFSKDDIQSEENNLQMKFFAISVRVRVIIRVRVCVRD